MCCGLQVVWTTISSFLLELWARRDEKICCYAVDMACIGFRSSPESVLMWLLHIGLHYMITSSKCLDFCARISNSSGLLVQATNPELSIYVQGDSNRSAFALVISAARKLIQFRTIRTAVITYSGRDCQCGVFCAGLTRSLHGKFGYCAVHCYCASGGCADCLV